jgi:hypothetical protein
MTALGSLTGALAIAFGLYAFAAGLGMALSPDRLIRMLKEAEGSAAISFVIGLLTFCIGVAVILTHPLGEGWLSMLVVIMGWGAMIEGLIFLAAPQIMWAITRPFMGNLSRIWGLVAMASGAALIAAGYCHL